MNIKHIVYKSIICRVEIVFDLLKHGISDKHQQFVRCEYLEDVRCANPFSIKYHRSFSVYRSPCCLVYSRPHVCVMLHMFLMYPPVTLPGTNPTVSPSHSPSSISQAITQQYLLTTLQVVVSPWIFS